jgi:hypothetical protein
MKRSTAYVSVVLLLTVLSGCGAAAKTIAMKAQSERADIFQEISGAEAVPPGYADLTIRANIKTHVEGYYIGESKESAHGKGVYPFLVNIDGQAAVWKAEGKMHVLPRYVGGKTNRDPEAGEGIKYVLNKKIRLRAGSHKLFFGLPEDDYYREVVIHVKEGEAQVMEFKPEYSYKTVLKKGESQVIEFNPVYKYKRRTTRIPTYLKGVSRYDIFVNGSPVAQ